MQMRFATGTLGCLICLTVLAGCQADEGMTTLEGSVTLDGKPLPLGSISFSPVDGQTPTAGGEIKEGRYSVRVPVGEMKVSLSAPKIIGKKKLYPAEDSPEMPITVEALPARYNETTELRLIVKAGPNQKDFPLQSELGAPANRVQSPE